MVQIYALKDNGKVFYIGQTINIRDRMYNHVTVSKNNATAKDKRISKIINKGRELSYEILAECKNVDALKLEQFYIKEYLTNGHKLCNAVICETPGYRKDLSELSPKELRVLQLLADDKTTIDISIEMKVSPRTIEVIRNRVKRKIGAKHTGGLIYLAVNKGIISL